MVLLSGCSEDAESQWERLALPIGASDRTESMFVLWVAAWIACAVVLVLVLGLMFWAMVRYRRRPGNEVPTQLRYHLPLEVLYTVAPVIIVAIFFAQTVIAQNEMLEKVDDPDHTITVVGSKWQFTFNYLDEEATGGEDVFDFGDTSDPTELWLPVDESVRFDLVSPDVIHSFWIPEFYFKQDVIPGKINSFDVTPTREGVFTGRCAELCGLYHTRMIFKVHVVSRDEYDAHLQKLQAAGQIGQPEGGAEAYRIAGLAEAKKAAAHEENGEDE
ncbi:cytochrome c oxidase subunit II [Mumia zhuanghuii]|uniref:Cytochrome c oxidase subunit 2 n=1 Tax=Mumia zhuanghuii TaxID=2585211 RepID=A0A5Q6S0T1_9ACTN|nr:cytochrome c oxidase subunit II [Mumia zhuanghuii]